MTEIRTIPNDCLKEEGIPGPDAPWWPDIQLFARSFSGYEYWGSMGKCVEIAMSPDCSTLTRLRTKLFFEHRAIRHVGEISEEDIIRVRELIERIRAKVRAAEFE